MAYFFWIQSTNLEYEIETLLSDDESGTTLNSGIFLPIRNFFQFELENPINFNLVSEKLGVLENYL
jgi:hypothetical protein